jgi:hypothetical protein
MDNSKQPRPENAIQCPKCNEGWGLISRLIGEGDYAVHCSKCSAETGWYVTEREALYAWKHNVTLNRNQRRK